MSKRKTKRKKKPAAPRLTAEQKRRIARLAAAHRAVIPRAVQAVMIESDFDSASPLMCELLRAALDRTRSWAATSSSIDQLRHRILDSEDHLDLVAADWSFRCSVRWARSQPRFLEGMADDPRMVALQVFAFAHRYLPDPPEPFDPEPDRRDAMEAALRVA